ncbi:hypothetical protein cyc_08267 [Cyclospora cayetanensis]|uniref:Uncharacterized protein n=1 Tax=Cyclospora cayetanensis TaxID=88456 RepID=A0A1D3CZ48_9EIME|nr:hypothetical protein cyc_08267 [Cyclospora cayetanensis]
MLIGLRWGPRRGLLPVQGPLRGPPAVPSRSHKALLHAAVRALSSTPHQQSHSEQQTPAQEHPERAGEDRTYPERRRTRLASLRSLPLPPRSVVASFLKNEALSPTEAPPLQGQGPPAGCQTSYASQEPPRGPSGGLPESPGPWAYEASWGAPGGPQWDVRASALPAEGRAMRVDEVYLHPALVGALKGLGLSALSAPQTCAFFNISWGRDVLLQEERRKGKTLGALLPVINRLYEAHDLIQHP